MQAALLKLVDERKLDEARKLLEQLHNLHGITDEVYDQLCVDLLEHTMSRREWEYSLTLAQATRCSDEREERIGDLTGKMGFLHD
jgi:hypothetical protein